jgi:hypothetical protein
MAAAYDKTINATEVLATRWPYDRDASRLFETRAAVPPTTTASFSPPDEQDRCRLSRRAQSRVGRRRVARARAAAHVRQQRRHPVPAFVANVANVGWVDEASPIPVRQLNVLGGPMLSPDKLAVLAVLSNEMLSGSNAEAMVRDALTRSAALALDQALLDANASTAARPAGLRYGISASKPHRSKQQPPTGFRSHQLQLWRWMPYPTGDAQRLGPVRRRPSESMVAMAWAGN